jgi:hypothetical protein
MDYIKEALKQRWYCELCERMHPIGAHTDPTATWPPGPAQPPRPPLDRDSEDVYRCHCGFHLFADPFKNNERAARHRAHVAEFQQRTQRLINQAMCAKPDSPDGPPAKDRLDDTELSALAALQRGPGARVVTWPQDGEGERCEHCDLFHVERHPCGCACHALGDC